MVVFRAYKYQAIGARDSLGKFGILNRFASVIDWEAELANVDQFGFHAFALLDLAKDKLRDVCASAPFARGAENDGNKEWAVCAHPENHPLTEVAFQLNA